MSTQKLTTFDVDVVGDCKPVFLDGWPVSSVGYWHQTGLTSLGNRPQGNQEPLMVKEKVGRPQVSLRWASPWNVILFPSVLWHCWLGDRKGVQPVKSWVSVVAIWLELCASYRSTTSIILNFNKIQNSDILVPANPDCSGKWPLNECRRWPVTTSITEVNHAHLAGRC